MLVCSWVRWMKGGKMGLHSDKILHVGAWLSHLVWRTLFLQCYFFSWKLTGTEGSSGVLLQLYKTLEMTVFHHLFGKHLWHLFPSEISWEEASRKLVLQLRLWLEVWHFCFHVWHALGRWCKLFIWGQWGYFGGCPGLSLWPHSLHTNGRTSNRENSGLK